MKESNVSRVPRFDFSDEVINAIYGRIKSDPITGIQVYKSFLSTAVDPFFEKLSRSFESEFLASADAFGRSRALRIWLPKSINLSVSGFGDKIDLIAKADVPRDNGSAFELKIPTEFQTEEILVPVKAAASVN